MSKCKRIYALFDIIDLLFFFYDPNIIDYSLIAEMSFQVMFILFKPSVK